MLQQRARALAAGDVEGYLAPLTPDARAVEEPIARGAVSVPLAEVQLTMDEGDIDRGGSEVNGARIDFVYRYEDLPEDNVFRFRLDSDMERRDGSWVVTKSAIRRRIGTRKIPVPMWATGPVGVASSAHFLAQFRPELGSVDHILQLAEQARERLLPSLTLEPEPRHLIRLARDDADFEQLLDEGPEPGVVAVAEYLFSRTYGHDVRPENRQITVDVQAVERASGEKLYHAPAHSPGRDHDEGGGRADRRGGGGHRPEPEITAMQVFEHELAHIVLSRFTRASTTAWVVEGAAMHLAKERRAVSWRAGMQLGLFDRLSFVTLSEQENLRDAMEYAYANAATSYLLETFGPERFWAFYRDFKEFRGGEDETHPLEEALADATHRLLRRIYDLDEERLDDEARKYISNAVGNNAGGNS